MYAFKKTGQKSKPPDSGRKRYRWRNGKHNGWEGFDYVTQSAFSGEPCFFLFSRAEKQGKVKRANKPIVILKIFINLAASFFLKQSHGKNIKTASARKPKGKCSSPAIQKVVITMLLNLKTEILSEDFHPSIRNLRLMLSVIKVIQRHLEKLADKEKK